ncbi:hypothetical protein RB614_25010 [Phytohabitans sp. ZYX-F-186]|uniref:Uncharacterized protein n=1 Tax=Phytohabitans maris TaxID=3071409 RepID=A0ABU0ZL59_9ACTN|nr:hypothetical protein [Phytohabitans sp. ZYX-F-186]MDQ7907786.1 hypothetical protein [Phytohabitans sp. ZYX-F-186]
MTGYFQSDLGFMGSLDASPWLGEQAWTHVYIGANEWDPHEVTAFSPYEYAVSLDMRGPYERVERLGWLVFDRLVQLGLPLAYEGRDADLMADFLPGRGVRRFPTGTDPEESNRVAWHEPRLHDDPAAPWGAEPELAVVPPGRVVVFETAGLLQVVPMARADGGWRWVAPAASIRASRGAHEVGLLLGSTLDTTSAPDRDDRAEIERLLYDLPGVGLTGVEDFGRRSVSVEVRSDGAVVTAVPHGPYRGAPDEPPSGPVVESLIQRQDTAGLDAAGLGRMMIDLISAVREHAPV